jgi:hypothetical protein
MTPQQWEAQLREMVFPLKNNSKVRPIVSALSCGQLPSDAERDLLRAAAVGRSEGRVSEKLAAMWALAYAGVLSGDPRSAADSLRTVLQNKEMSAGHRTLLRGSRAVGRSLLIGGFLAVMIWLLLRMPDNPGLRLLIGLFAGPTAIAVIAGPLYFLVQDWDAQILARTEAARILGVLGFPEDIALLAATSWDAAITTRKEAARALRGILQTIDQSHYGRLPADTTPGLCQLLESPDEALALLAVDALREVGDGRAIDSLEHAVQKSPSWDVRMAAARVLPILEERRRRGDDPSVLVRSSDAPPTEASLLRPASGSRASNPDSLPRAADVPTVHQQSPP